MSSPYLWDESWSRTKDDREFWRWAQRENGGVREGKIISYIEKHLGNINGLRTIEVGSGTGLYSFIFAKRGASVTLMDYSRNALLLAHKYFDSLGLPASFIQVDALNLNSDLLGKFDVAMSFGTIEHYRYQEQLIMAKAHLDLVKPGGVVIISVPNRCFFFHEFFKYYLQQKNKWHLGYEKSFTKGELLRLGKKLSLENIKIYGSAFFADTFWYLNILQQTRSFKGFFHNIYWQLPLVKFPSFLDNLFGAAIFLLGCKPIIA